MLLSLLQKKYNEKQNDKNMIPLIIILIATNIYTFKLLSKKLIQARNDNERLRIRIEKLSSKKQVKFSSDENLNNIINNALKDGKTHIKLNDKSRLKYPSRIKTD